MKKLLFALAALVFVSTVDVPKAYAGGPFDYTWNYYSDSTFTTATGWYEQFCDDSVDYAGTFTNYRLEERTNCETNGEFGNCQIWNSTTNTWDTVECPPPTYDGRLRIPVGGS